MTGADQLRSTIAAGLAAFANAWPAFQAHLDRQGTAPVVATWSLVLAECDPAAVQAAMIAAIRAGGEFAPSPGRIRDACAADRRGGPELLAAAILEPDSALGLVARECGALRAGDVYDDGRRTYYAPSETGDPIGRQVAARTLAAAWADAQADAKRFAELSGRAAELPSLGAGIAHASPGARQRQESGEPLGLDAGLDEIRIPGAGG